MVLLIFFSYGQLHRVAVIPLFSPGLRASPSVAGNRGFCCKVLWHLLEATLTIATPRRRKFSVSFDIAKVRKKEVAPKRYRILF